jgi:hypothetical protein
MTPPKKQAALTLAAGHGYRNPVILAQEWEKALAEGRYASSADLSRRIGVSRARVTQILRLAPKSWTPSLLVVTLFLPLS